MFDRTRFTWDVLLSTDSGATQKGAYSSYWSPDKTAPSEVAIAAAAEATVGSGGRTKFIPISAKVRS